MLVFWTKCFWLPFCLFVLQHLNQCELFYAHDFGFYTFMQWIYTNYELPLALDCGILVTLCRGRRCLLADVHCCGRPCSYILLFKYFDWCPGWQRKLPKTNWKKKQLTLSDHPKLLNHLAQSESSGHQHYYFYYIANMHG